MEDFRMKLQNESNKLIEKVKNGEVLTPEETKILFLKSFIAEEENEQ